MPSSATLRKLVVRAGVALPLCTLVVCYLIKQPQWPTIHPSAVFDYGVPRVIASLGFSVSAPFMTAFGAVRYVRDLAVNDNNQSILRGGTFFAVIVGLLGVAAVPWHVSHSLHTACAVTFFFAAALDIILQHIASRHRLARGASGGCCEEVVVLAARWLALVLCFASVMGQVTQYHPLMGIGECGFAVMYLIVLGVEGWGLEQVSVQLVPGIPTAERGSCVHDDRSDALLQNN